MTAADEEPLLLAVPLASAGQMARIVSAGLTSIHRADGGKPTPEAERLLRELYNADQGRRSSVPGTPPPAPTTVEPGLRNMLGMGEAAARYGCTPEYLRRLARTGQLPAQRVGHVWLVDERDLDALRYGRTEDTSGQPGPAPRERAADSG